MSINLTKMQFYSMDKEELKAYYKWNVEVKKKLDDDPNISYDWDNDSEETLRNKIIDLYKYNIKRNKCAWKII